MIWGVLGLLPRGVDTLGGFLRVGVLLVFPFSLMIWCVSSSMLGIVSSRVFIGTIVCLSLVCVLFVFFNVSMGFILFSVCISLVIGTMGIIFIVIGVIGVIYLEGRGSLGNGPKMPPHGALIYRGMKHLKRYHELFEELDQRDFRELEEFADDLFSELGLDIVFTKHFKDRVNDWRESKRPITYEELEKFFMHAYQSAGQALSRLPHNKEVVLRDSWSRLNSPVIMKKRGRDRDLLMQTIMRKRNFDTPDEIISI